MPQFLIKIAIDLSVHFLSKYIKSTDTQHDDKILKITKESIKYLKPKLNNTTLDIVDSALDDVEV